MQVSQNDWNKEVEKAELKVSHKVDKNTDEQGQTKFSSMFIEPRLEQL